MGKTQVPLDMGLAVVDAEAEFLLDLDPLVVADHASVLSLDLYRGVRMQARRTRTRQYQEWMSWSGHIYFPDLLGSETPAGHILLINHGGRVTGVIGVDATNEEFQILSSPGGSHRLVRMKRTRRPSCAVHFDESQGSTDPIIARMSAPAGSSMEQSTSQIDVLALILFGQDSQQTRDFIQLSVSAANDFFAQSSVDANYNLLGPVVTGSSDVPSKIDTVDQYLFWMNGDGKVYVEGKRNQYNADMVVLFVQPVQPGEQDGCGIANLPYRNPQGEIRYMGSIFQLALVWTDEAYSVQRIQCGLNDLTFAHELGHNYGLRHDINDLGGSLDPPYEPIDPHPRGHEFSTAYGRRASVMGCITPDSCCRVGYYSDPNFTPPYVWGAEPTGSYAEHAAAAEVLRVRVQEYELFR